MELLCYLIKFNFYLNIEVLIAFREKGRFLEQNESTARKRWYAKLWTFRKAMVFEQNPLPSFKPNLLESGQLEATTLLLMGAKLFHHWKQ